MPVWGVVSKSGEPAERGEVEPDSGPVASCRACTHAGSDTASLTPGALFKEEEQEKGRAVVRTLRLAVPRHPEGLALAPVQPASSRRAARRGVEAVRPPAGPTQPKHGARLDITARNSVLPPPAKQPGDLPSHTTHTNIPHKASLPLLSLDCLLAYTRRLTDTNTPSTDTTKGQSLFACPYQQQYLTVLSSIPTPLSSLHHVRYHSPPSRPALFRTSLCSPHQRGLRPPQVYRR